LLPGFLGLISESGGIVHAPYLKQTVPEIKRGGFTSAVAVPPNAAIRS
jgi:hypothetical protein